MSNLEKYTLEYSLTTSTKLLYTLISTPEGLSRWFAEAVQQDDDLFTFSWEGTNQTARMIHKQENETVVFQWMDNQHENIFFEMRIISEDVSPDVTLIVTDYSEPSDIDLSKLLWNSNIGQLKRLIEPQ
ncbi:MAG: SRPBCC domain-containing protein [Bacteroidales bacterium]|nr:SRPBCC domain-containing protein [Bacteroidales bacterium]